MRKPFEYEKILTYYKEAKMIRAGQMPSPRMALIYPSYVCGHHCAGCHYKDWNRAHKDSGFMDYDKFCNLVENLTVIGVEAIEFCGGGEPTKHPDFNKMLGVIQGEGLKFGMFTNGQDIDQERGELLTDMASYVRISIDQEAEWESAKRLIETRNSKKSHCLIGAKILVSALHQAEFREKIDKCLGMDFDYVQIKPEKPTKTPFTGRAKKQVNDIINYYREKHPRKIFGGLDHTELKGKCWLSPIHTMIDVYGDIYICCYFQFREDSHKIGNCFGEDSFEKVWYSKRHVEAIAGIQKKECDVFDCRYHGYNITMSEALKHGHLEFS